jgi:hypothetical protein
MRKLVYLVVAILGFYASSICYAQSAAEMATAKKQYDAFKSYYPTLKENLNKSLKEAKAAQKTGSNFDNSSYKSYKEVLQEQYNDNGVPVIELQKKYPVVRDIGNKELEKYRTDIENKYQELSGLVSSIDSIIKNLKASQLTSKSKPRMSGLTAQQAPGFVGIEATTS